MTYDSTRHPHVTVASVLEKNNAYLIVKEEKDNRIVLNQPAGHLKRDESLVDAAKREVLEETGWQVKIKYLIGIYQYHSAINDTCYLRFCFAAEPVKYISDERLDEEIIDNQWVTKEFLYQNKEILRSEMVLKSIEDYEAQKKYPLSLLSTL